MYETPMYQTYEVLAPRVEDWPRLLDKMGQALGKDYDYGDSVRAIQSPVLLAFADADSVRPSHAVRFFELLGGGQQDAGFDGALRPNSQLTILPGETHHTTFASPPFGAAVVRFLDGV